MNKERQKDAQQASDASDACLVALLTGLREFFEGTATLCVGELKINFVREKGTDDERDA